jgi:recombination protein RecR
MSAKLPEPVQAMIDTFNRLPGIGPKMAGRLTFYLLQKSEYEINRFIGSLEGIKSGLQTCEQCGNISDQTLCSVCRETGRNEAQICVVEGPLDVVALERTNLFHGLYHVLGGVLSPMDGIGPDQLRITLLHTRLTKRVHAKEATEIIMATNPSLEGEATASYLTQLFQPYVQENLVTITRIARGLPMGSDIEYADPTTLARALEGRNNL